MRHVAFADRSGVIRFGRRCPRGAPRIGQHRRFDSPRGAVSSGRDRETLLVPSAPEAKSDDDLAAVVAVVKGVETRLKERAS